MKVEERARMTLAQRLNRPLYTLGVGLLACAALVSGVPAAASAIPVSRGVQDTVRFNTQAGGLYDGMPVFDGNPDHVDAYIDTLLGYLDFEGVVRWAQGMRGDYTIKSGPNTGKIVPGMPRWSEGVQGVSTDFPAPIAMGQTWNADLMSEIGNVMGTERINQEDFLKSISEFNPMINSALQDIRINPLTGRLDEGIGEDPNLASDLLEPLARSISGIDAEGNDQGFWTQAFLNSKHYTSYTAQWFRRPGNSDVTARALMEYYSRPIHSSIESGAVGGILTTYGRTNGVPNSLSPIINYAQEHSRWGESGGLYTVPDNGADRQLPVDHAFSNGFDIRYTPSLEDVTALMMVAEQGSAAVNTRGAESPLTGALIANVENGTYGVTKEDVYDVASAQVMPQVRMGLFNERDEAGYPKYYPFVDRSAASATPVDASVREHQDVAMRAAEESLVVLKNDNNVLPLNGSADLTVVGPLADARFGTINAAKTPELPNAGLTPVQGIRAEFGDDVTSASDGNVVALKSVATGKYLTHDESAAPVVVASADDAGGAAQFEAFAWGQGAYGYRSTTNDQWLQFAQNAVNVGGSVEFGTPSTAMPNRIRPQFNDDGTVSFVVDSFIESFGGGFETRYYTHGRYLTVDPATGQLGVTGVFGDAANAARLNTPETKFLQDVVQQAGSQAVSEKSKGKYAVVVVGVPPRNSNGEGADRATLRMGEDQYELIDTVSEAYPKKTIVVVASSNPVLLEEVHENKNVAGIVLAPYNGQYGNYALGKLLSGEAAPTGRLTHTWYADMSALPAMDEYSLPEGPNELRGMDGLDPRYTVDMTNGDPVETDLTYMYTDAPVTYEFGYGLSYSKFAYSNLRLASGSPATMTATVDVKNTGKVDTAEVVQLYGSNDSSAYGDAAPKRKLVGFEKVQLKAGEKKTVTITFDTEKLALWDNVTNGLVVEAGEYLFEVGSSSSDIKAKKGAKIAGVAMSAIDARTAPVNVFDHSFDTSNVTYREASKQNTVDGLRADELVSGYYVTMSRAPGAWTALNDVDFTGSTRVAISVASGNPSSALEVRIGAPDGPVVADVTTEATGVSEYVIPGTNSEGDIPVAEMAYRDVTVDLTQAVEGKHDLYIVFKDADVRVKQLQLLE
jgi:beta-glucosidase-like glycosyl hydrolase